MPPPGVPNWLFPTMVLHTVGAIDREGAGGPTFTLWVESVNCLAIDPTGDILINYRPLRSRPLGWVVGMPAVVPLVSFLAMVRSPEELGGGTLYLSPPDITLDPETYGDEEEEDLGSMVQVPFPTSSGERVASLRVGMLGAYLSMYERLMHWHPNSPENHSFAREALEQMLEGLGRRLGLATGSRDTTHEGVWRELQSLLISPLTSAPGPESTPEPRSRFEREPPV